jgi:outer membrane autotransporter protein
MARNRAVTAAASIAIFTGAPVMAADPAYQAFFFSVCGGTPTGALAARCAQTPGGLGNLSGDSESSLNPSQNLSHGRPAVSSAQTRSKAARERGENLRDLDLGDAAAGPAMQIGPVSLLLHVHGSRFEQTASAAAWGERGFEGDTRAFEAGVDLRLSPRVVVGALLGVDRNEFEFDSENPGVAFTPANIAGDADVDTTYLTAFAAFALSDSAFLEFSAGYERSDNTFRRQSVFQESTRTLAQTNVATSGNADSAVTWISANLGADWSRGAANLGPYAGVTSTRVKTDAFTETDNSNSGLAMSFASATRKSLLAHAGVKWSYSASTSVGVVLPQIRVEYQYEFEDTPQRIAASFALDPNNTSFELQGYGGDRSAINAGAGVAAILANGWLPFIEYAILLDQRAFDRQRLTLGIRKEF